MKHLSLDLAVNFDTKTLSGSATIDIENKSGTDTLMLDVRDLTISEVSIDGEKTTYEIGPAKPYLGSPMAVVIKQNTKQVKIRYTTSPSAAA